MTMASGRGKITTTKRKATGAGSTTVSTFGRIVLTIVSLKNTREAMTAAATATEEEISLAREMADGASIEIVAVIMGITVVVIPRTDTVLAKTIAGKCQVQKPGGVTNLLWGPIMSVLSELGTLSVQGTPDAQEVPALVPGVQEFQVSDQDPVLGVPALIPLVSTLCIPRVLSHAVLFTVWILIPQVATSIQSQLR